METILLPTEVVIDFEHVVYNLFNLRTEIISTGPSVH